MLRNQGFRIDASDQKYFFRFLDLGERIFADFRDFGDLEPGRRALERSEAGRQAPGRILVDFQWIFFSPGSKSHGFFLAGDENLLILLIFIDFHWFSLIFQGLACPERVPRKK